MFRSTLARMSTAAYLVVPLLLVMALACGGSGGGGGTPAPTPAPTPTPVPTPPSLPMIRLFAADKPFISPGGSTTLTCTFSNGTGVVTPGVGPVTPGTVTVSPAEDTFYTLTVTGTTGVAVIQTFQVKVLPDPALPVIQTWPSVTAGQTGVSATVAVQLDTTFRWGIQGGVLTSGGQDAAIAFTVTGQPGTQVVLTCTATNAAGARSAEATLAVPITGAPAPMISAPAVVTAGQGGYSASVAAPAGATCTWAITGNGTLASGNGTPTIQFNAGGPGTLTLTCQVAGAAGTAALQVSVVAAPDLPVVTAPLNATVGRGGYTASVPDQPGANFMWTIGAGGTLTSGATTRAVTFAAGASGNLVLTCAVTNATGLNPVTGTATVRVSDPPQQPIVEAPASVTAGVPGYVASVADQPGCTFNWSLDSGTLTAGNGTRTVTFTPGTTATATLTCSVANPEGILSAPGSLTLQVDGAAPAAATVSAPANVTAGKGGLVASVPAQPGATYAWTVPAGATLTAGQGTNQITFQAGPVGSLTLGCAVTTAGGSVTATPAVVTVVAAPSIVPFAPDLIPTTVNGSAVVTPVFTGGSGMLYGGDFGEGRAVTSGTPLTLGTGSISSAQYVLLVSNAAGDTARAGFSVFVRTSNLVITSFTASSPVLGPGQSTNLTPVFTLGDGGTASVDPGVGPVVSGQSYPVTPGATTVYTLTLGDASGTTTGRQVKVQVGALTLLAGAPTGRGALDGPAGKASFNGATGIATDDHGTTFVADTYNNVIRTIGPDGTVGTLAGQPGASGYVDATGAAARFNGPASLAWDPNRQVLYVADDLNNVIRQVTPQGVVTTLAGAADATPFADGTLATARFQGPGGLAMAVSGDLYVADSINHRIRRVQIGAGLVTTLAGTGTQGAQDGPGAAATFMYPRGLVVDGGLNVYVADTGNGLIRQVDPSGTVTTLAGGGHQVQGSGPGSQANFLAPEGVAVLSSFATRVLYVTDTGHATVRKLTLNPGVVPQVDDVAGFPDRTGDADGADATFNVPTGVTLGNGLILVADTGNSLIRRLSPTIDGYWTATLAGQHSRGPGWTDQQGATAQFSAPMGMAFDSVPNLYVADSGNSAIRKVTAEGTVTTNGPSGSQSTNLATPTGLIATQGPAGGQFFVANVFGPTIASIPWATGVPALYAGQPGVFGSATGPRLDSTFRLPTGMATDGVNLYVADAGSSVIYQITLAGNTSILAGQVDTSGNADAATGTAATFSHPVGLVVVGNGLYVADRTGQTIRRIDLLTTAVTTLAGLGDSSGFVDGPGPGARFNGPAGLAVDAAGNLLVADSGNHAIRMISPEGQVVTVVGGNGLAGFLAGNLPASLFQPSGIAVHPLTGDYFISMPDAILQVHFQ